MANQDRATGYTPVAHMNGSPYNGQQRKYYSDANDLFMGDLVIKNTAAVASGSGVYPAVDRATATTELLVGVVVGWERNPTALENLYHVASTTYAVYIADARDLIMEAQSDDATMVQSDVGLNIDGTFTAGTTATGVSGMELSGSSAATTAGLQFRIVGAVDRPDNDASDSVANQRFLVTMNQSAWADQSAGL